MCKCLTDLFCCCFKGNTNVRKTNIKNRIRGKDKKKGTNTRYGTNWETMTGGSAQISPSEIDDNLLTEDIDIDRNQFTDQNQFYRAALISVGYNFDPEKDHLGMGAFGEVYKIKDQKSGELLALKIVKIGTGVNAFSKARFEMFKNEVITLRLNPHKNIITLIKHFMMSRCSLCFMIMEFATEGDLNRRLKSIYEQTGQPFSESIAKTYFAQIANAMNFVHSKGYIHGDLKLDNVLITKTNDGKEVIKVSDFGCARIAFKDDMGLIKSKGAKGTIIYMSPEMLRVYLTVNLKKKDVNKASKKRLKHYNPFRADVWALGVCLYRLLLFEHPFKFDPKREVISVREMINQMKKGHPMTSTTAKTLSIECKDLLNSLLMYSRTTRIDTKTVMIHKWVVNCPDLDKI